jgi:hypothetical protein
VGAGKGICVGTWVGAFVADAVRTSKNSPNIDTSALISIFSK